MAKGTALITGASSGIGAELARLCAGDGYDLVLVARRARRLEDLARTLTAAHGVKVRAIAADLSQAEAPSAIFEAAGPVDILINNAGFGWRGRFSESDWASQAALMQVNMAAPAHLSRLFLPGMLERASGRILNVASTAAFVPGPFMALYYASKAFLLSFSEALSNELKGTGVTATVLCPGVTRTEFFDVAGMPGSRLVHSRGAMEAHQVAREGYRAMLAGKPEAIAGALNRWTMRGARLMPRTALAEIAGRLNQNAG